jgi:endonuclease I
MVSDINFIRATDGKVNGMRSNYPYGKVGTAYLSKW